MLLKRRSSFFSPAYPSCIVQAYRFSRSPLQRDDLFISSKPTKVRFRRGYASQRPNFSGSVSDGSGSGIPLGQIPLGSKIGSQKGIAIKDDITKSWKELSIPQKIVRTGTQTTNLAIVVFGIGVLVARLFMRKPLML